MVYPTVTVAGRESKLERAVVHEGVREVEISVVQRIPDDPVHEGGGQQAAYFGESRVDVTLKRPLGHRRLLHAALDPELASLGNSARQYA